MSESEKVKAFVTELHVVLIRYRSEMEMTAASMVGSLEILKQNLIKEILNDVD